MKFYITSGTRAFMKNIWEKKAVGEIIFLQGEGEIVLLHETEKKSVFASPRKYITEDGHDGLTQDGTYILHYFSVEKEDHPIFEERFQANTSRIELLNGLMNYRLLKPVKADTFIILTQWQSLQDYHRAAQMYDFKERFQLEKPSNIFVSKNYIKTYNAPNEVD